MASFFSLFLSVEFFCFYRFFSAMSKRKADDDLGAPPKRSRVGGSLNTLLGEHLIDDLVELTMGYLIDCPYESIMLGIMPSNSNFDAVAAADICINTNNIELFSACLAKFDTEQGTTNEHKSVELEILIKNSMALNRVDFARILANRYPALLPGYLDVFTIRENKEFPDDYKIVTYGADVLLFGSLYNKPFLDKIIETHLKLDDNIIEEILHAAAKLDDVVALDGVWTQLASVIQPQDQQDYIIRLLPESFLIGSQNVVKYFIEKKLVSPPVVQRLVSAAFECNDISKALWLFPLLRDHCAVECESFYGRSYIHPSYFTECMNLFHATFGRNCKSSWFRDIIYSHRKFPKTNGAIIAYMNRHGIIFGVPRMNTGGRASQRR